MNVESLIYFKYLADYKNFTKAAEYFFVSQSTLSRQIMALEEELGVKLLNRNNRSVVLTPEGEALNEEVDSLIQHLEIIKDKIVNTSKGNSGCLKIMSIGTIEPLIDKHIKVFIKNFPNVKFSLEYYSFDKMVDAIRFKIFDAAFIFGFASNFENSEDFAHKTVAKEKFVIMCNSSVKNKEEFLKNLTFSPLILPPFIDPPIIGEWKNFIKTKFNKDKDSINYLNTTQSIIMHVKANLGYSIVPENLIKDNYNTKDLNFIDLEDIIDRDASTDIVMIYNKKNENRALRNFIDILEMTN